MMCRLKALPVLAALFILLLAASQGRAQTTDPFLGIPILTSGASSPGAPVTSDNHATIVKTADGDHGIAVDNSAAGYDGGVLSAISGFSDAPFSFTTLSVTNANGTAGSLGGNVTGHRVDDSAHTTAGAGGTFVLNANGTFSFVPGTDFADLANGTSTKAAVRFVVRGTNGATSATKNMAATLVVKVERSAAGVLSATVVGARYDDYGSSSKPTSAGTVFPDLKAFANSMLRFSFGGQAGSGVVVTNDGQITTTGLEAYGILAKAFGVRGYDGSDADIDDSSEDGGVGGLGGPVTVTADGTVVTTRDRSVGVLAWSLGGDGGQGGDSGWFRNSKGGGDAGTGGVVNVFGSGTITTYGKEATGVMALSQGGNGGAGGDGDTFDGASDGAAGGRGGTIYVQGAWTINTSGESAHGIWAKSFGGHAGNGGSGGWTGTSAGGGGVGTEGGSVTVISDGKIHTGGDFAIGILGQSIGGFGGNGGSTNAIFYAAGGDGNAAGSGGTVNITNGVHGEIVTTGKEAHGIQAQSMGGGGGNGGAGGSLVAFGGHGASGGNADDVRVTNNGKITVTGAGSRGIYAQSIGGGGGDGGNSSGFAALGGDGSTTSDGGAVRVTNNGTIFSRASAVFAQSIGGGGGNGGSSTGLFSVGGSGGSGGNADIVNVTSHGNLTTTEENASAIFAESLGGGGGNGGNSTAVGAFVAVAIGGSGDKGGTGSDVKVGVNVDTGLVDAVTGQIRTYGDNSNGIQAQSVGGGGGNGGYALSAAVGVGGSAAFGLGGKGGGGNDAASASVFFGNATSQIVTSGNNANGIFAQSVGGGGGTGGFSIAASGSTGFAASLSFGGDGGTGGNGGLVNVGSALNPLKGSIYTSGAHSYGVLAQSVGGGGGNGGLSIAGAVAVKGGGGLAFGGSGSGGGSSAAVKLYSQGTIVTTGSDSHGLFAQSVGGGGGSGGAAIAATLSAGNSLNVSFGGSAASGGSAGTVGLTSTGTSITTYGAKSYGLLAQSIGGGGGDGGFAISGAISGGSSVKFSMGGGGGAGGVGNAVTVMNATALTTWGKDSHALFAQSVGGGGGSGGFSVSAGIDSGSNVSAGIGGAGAAGGVANTVNVTNTASQISTAGDRAYGILAQSIGGGGGDGGFTVDGGISRASSVALGIGGPGASGGDAARVDVTSASAIYTQGQLAHGLFAQSVGGGGGSGGFAIAGTVSSGNNLDLAIGGGAGSAGVGGQVWVTNDGAIATGGAGGTGQGSYGILAQSVGGGGGTGGFAGSIAGSFGGNGKAVALSVGGNGGDGGDSDEVHVTNRGAINTLAENSIGLFAQSIGGGGGDGGFGLAVALETSNKQYALGGTIGGQGGTAGDSKLVDVTNYASIQTAGANAQGLFAQSIGGGGGNGGFAIAATGATGKEAKSVALGIGGEGGSAGDARDVIVRNYSSILTTGDDSFGIQAQSLGGGGGNGGFSITGDVTGPTSKGLSLSIGGKGNGGGDAGTVTLLGTAGSITTEGARSSAIQAQSVGGGGGNGGFSGSLALGDGGNSGNKPTQAYAISVGGSGGVGGVGGDVKVGTDQQALQATIETSGAEAIGIHAQSIGGGGGNGGFSLAGAINLITGQGPNQDVAITVGGNGGNGNNAGNVLVNHIGSIYTAGDGAYGIEAQSIGGGGGNGGGARSITLQLAPKEKLKPDEKKQANKNTDLALSIGGNGAGASDAGTVTVRHTGDITTVGGDAHGIFAQSIGGGGGTGGDASEGIPDIMGLPLADLALAKKDKKSKNPVKDLKIVVGGQGGSSGNADAVFVRNDGAITTWGDGAHGIFAQSIGGGGGAGGTADLGLTGTLGIGGGTGSTGDGGTVRVEATGSISTIGDSAHAVFAQSIGGGGGAAGDVDRGLTDHGNIGLGFAYGQGGGNAGDGGVVTVDSHANLFTFGSGSSGIFAQSIGGGGGVAGTLGNGFGPLSLFNFAGSVGGDGSASDVHVTQAGDITVWGDGANGIFAQSAAGPDAGKAVDVTLNSGNIMIYGTQSNGIMAQSLGQASIGTVTVTIANAASTVMGGVDAAAVRFLDGADNILLNRGTLTTMAGLEGTTIAGTGGSEHVTNFGTVVGSFDLGAGLNTFRNEASGLLLAGDALKVGSGNALTNLGTISPSGWGELRTTTIDGNFVQSGNPIWNMDTRASGESDLLHVDGSAQFTGSATHININQLAPWQSGSTFTMLEATGGLTGGTFQLGSLNGVMPLGQTFSLISTGSAVQMTLQPSRGDFVFASETGGSWITPFANGATAWSNAAGNIYGTPGALSDVRIATNAPTSMGADFEINSLTFDLAGSTLAGGNTLTLLASRGAGIEIDRGDGDTILGADIMLGNSQSWLNDSRGVFYVAGRNIEGSGHTLTIQGGGSTVVSAAIVTNRGGLVKEGTGTLYLTGANAYSGGTLIKEGIVVGDTHSLQGAITDNGGLVFDQTQAGVFASSITGTGWLVKRGNGALTLTAPQSYSGGTWIASGLLKGTTTSLQGDIITDGVLQFDQSQAGTFAGRVNGIGQLLKTGTGSLNFTGDSSAFQGQTTIAGGLFSVNGRLGGSSLLMQAGTTLGGNGVVPTTTIASGATLAPGNSIGRLLVGGDITLSAGSIYRVETAADMTADLLLVDGALNVAGALDLQVSAERYHPINFFTIAVARGLDGAFSSVTSSAANLVPSLQYGKDSIGLTLRRNDVDFRQTGTVGNQTAVAEVYNQLVPSATGAMAGLVNQMFDVANAAAADDFGSIAGTHYQHIARSNLASAQIVTSSALTRLAVVGGDFSADTNAIAPMASVGRVRPGVWFNGLSVDMRSHGGDGDPGARAPMRGMTFGADAVASRHVTLGVNGGYAVTDVTARRDGGDYTRSELLEGGLYGRYQLGGSRVDGALAYGRHDNAVSRRVSDGAGIGRAVAALDGETVTGQLNYGYRQPIGRGFSVQPEMRWQQGTLRLDGATERGAGMLDLTVPGRRESSQRLLAGGRIGKLFRGRAGEFAIEGRAALAREYRELDPLHATIAGDLWTGGFLIGEPGHRDRSGVYGLSLSGRYAALQFFANADAEVDGSMSGWAGTFGVNASW